MMVLIQSMFFCKNRVVKPLPETGPSIQSCWKFIVCVTLCAHCHFLSTFSSVIPNQQLPSLLHHLLGENLMCSASSSYKSESLEKSCSLLPQRVAVLFCDYSQHLTGEIHISCDSLQQHCISHGSTHRSCFSSLLGILSPILIEWWGRDRTHYSGSLLLVFPPLICFDASRTYSRDGSCSSSRNTPLVPSVTSGNRWEGWLLTENCHTVFRTFTSFII